MWDRDLVARTPRHKVARIPEFREVTYSATRWEILRRLRRDASRLMKALKSCGLEPITHGSLARGDVNSKSDVDIVIPYRVQAFLVELCLENHGIQALNRFIIQATPASTPKAYIEVDPSGLRTVSFPLSDLSPREWEFYRFGGMVSYEELVRDVRVPGVSKSLVLIIPTEKGHREAPVVGYEHYVAKVVSVSIETVVERVNVLTRRDRHGRTGVYLKYQLLSSESFEEAFNKLIESGRLKTS